MSKPDAAAMDIARGYMDRDPNICGVGIGAKRNADDVPLRDSNGKMIPAIVFHVGVKLPMAGIPEELRIPNLIRGFATDVVSTGGGVRPART